MKKLLFASFLIILLVFQVQAGGLVGSGISSGGACTWQTAWSVTTDGQSTDGTARNYRNTIAANTSSYSGTKIRVTVTGSSTGTSGVIVSSSIGLMSSTNVFDSTPTVITWNSGSAGATVANNVTLVSDEIPFTFTKTNRYGIHFYLTNRDFTSHAAGEPADGVYYDPGVADGSMTLIGIGSPYPQHIPINKLEVCVPWSTKILIFIILMCLLIPVSSFGAIDLPWSTTYNCADWTTYGGTLNCDGLSKGLGSPDSEGHYELIVAAPNYSGGGGYKGQRHYLCDAVNDCSGGTVIYFNAGQPEIWVRWYIKFETGFKWANYSYGTKVLYFLKDGGTNLNYILMGYGADRFSYYAQDGDQLHHTCESGCGWTTLWGTESDGSWHCLEMHIKSETVAANDGILEVWEDGVRKINETNVDHGLTSKGSLLYGIIIGSNVKSAGNGKCMYVDYDDIAINNTGYIGPLPSNYLPGKFHLKGGSMKRLFYALILTLALAGSAGAMGPLMVDKHTAAWDREADSPGIYTVAGYYIYWRIVHTPVNPWVNTQRSALVSQPSVGIVPIYDLTALSLANGNYELCATAIDTKGDESGPSNIVPFTWAIPASLTNFVIQ